MNFLWHTALSVIDLSSSLFYNLLGRDLTELDIKLVEQLFVYVSKTELAKLLNQNRSQLNLSAMTGKLTMSELERLIEFDSKNINNLIHLIIERIEPFKSKDLLLITNKHNGYNLIQTMTSSILKLAHNVLSENLKFFMEKNMSNIENDFDYLITQRLNLFALLLKSYSCDPNRGLLMSNKTKYCVQVGSADNFIDTVKRSRQSLKLFHENKSFRSNNVLVDFEVSSSEESQLNDRHNEEDAEMPNQDKTKIESETPSEMTADTIVKNSPLRPGACVRPASPCSYISNIDLAFVTNNTDEKNMCDLGKIAIDTPLLIICCVFNSTNLACWSNVSKRCSTQSLAKNERYAAYRRNTIQTETLAERSVARGQLSRSNSLNSVDQCDLYSFWSSSSSSSTKTRSSSSFSSCSSLSFNSFNSSLISSYSKSADSISKLFKQSAKLNKTKLAKSESESSENFNPISYSESHHSSDECLTDDDSDSESVDSSNLYDYKEKDELNYYDKYDYDFNSACYKLNSSDNYSVECTHWPPKNSLSTSAHSLISSYEKCAGKNFKSTTCSTRSNSSAKTNNFIYEKLNKLRLKLVDLLLDNGADKYLISKLSVNNQCQMNKKSKLALQKWFSEGNRSECSVSEPVDDLANSEADLNAIELRPLSPIMASLCLDDVDIFSRLYKHQQLLFSYFKPDEDYELIYYAIKFQSKNCLVYLLSNLSEQSLPSLFNSQYSISNSRVFNKNVNTMFYILENTRSSKIIKVLLNCGFDLTKREPITGNTALHCLFNAKVNNKFSKNKKVLSEYSDPKSLSRILFLMLKRGGLKTHVNTLNNERKLCIQSLFEWDELIETVLFKEAKSGRHEWKAEFKECVHLLLKSGADLLLNVNNIELENEGYHNCIETLIDNLLRHSVLGRRNLRNRSPSLLHSDTKSNLKSTKFSLQKILDIEFLEHILNDVVDLNFISFNLSKNGPLTGSSDSGASNHHEHGLRLAQRNCSVEKYLELLLNCQIDDFSSAHEIFKILLNFQRCLNNKIKIKFKLNSNNKQINPQIVKRLITSWILYPNFMNSSQQFEKNNFIKHILVELIKNGLLEPNELACQSQTNGEYVQSNNLLNHCVQLVFLSKTCYQMELVYDLMRTLIQYGADPNLEPFGPGSPRAHRCARLSSSILAQLCDPFLTERSAPILTSVNLSRHHRTHHNHHNYFNDYFKDNFFAVINEHGPLSHYHVSPLVSEKEIEVSRRMSEGCVSPSLPARKNHLSSPICLLTPSPSCVSLLGLSGAINQVLPSLSIKSNNIVVDSMVLFLNYYKRFVKLLFDSMENSKIHEIVVAKHLNNDLQFCSHYGHQHHHSFHHSSNHRKNVPHSKKIYSIEPLDMYLERLVSSPRSLKSICRRMILNRLKENVKLANDLNNETGAIQVAAQIDDLPAPKRVKNYLLFIE